MGLLSLHGMSFVALGCNLYLISHSAWEFYGVQRKELTAIRTGFLVRLLVVDVEPFQTIWKKDLSYDGPWETRYYFYITICAPC